MVMKSSTTINNKSPNHDTKLLQITMTKQNIIKNHPLFIILNHLLHAQTIMQNVTQKEKLLKNHQQKIIKINSNGYNKLIKEQTKQTH